VLPSQPANTAARPPASTAGADRKPAARGGATAPQNYPLMGDFRRPQPSAADTRRPVETAHAPAPAPAPRAPAAEHRAPAESRPEGAGAPAAAPDGTPLPAERGRSDAPHPQAAPAPPARSGPPSASPRGGHAAPAPAHSPNSGRGGRGG
jgi:hypothetical protein